MEFYILAKFENPFIRGAVCLEALGEQWFQMSRLPGSLMGNWPDHMASYWEWRDRPNVLLLYYPEMKKDLPGTVDKVAALMEVELTVEWQDAVRLRWGYENRLTLTLKDLLRFGIRS